MVTFSLVHECCLASASILLVSILQLLDTERPCLFAKKDQPAINPTHSFYPYSCFGLLCYLTATWCASPGGLEECIS